jgi:excisionase family DNA binding protein
MTTSPLLTADEVAALLRLSVDSVYAYAREGRLAAIRFGRAVRFQRGDIDAFIATAAKRPRLVTRKRGS